MRKVYVCRNAKQCYTGKSHKKLTCKYCRFTTCLREGLQVEEVQAFHVPITEEETSVLSNATKAWRWSFLLRKSALSEVHGSQAVQLARALFPRWTGFESMRQMVRNKGFRTKLAYNVDESIVRCDEEGLTAYYRTFNALRGDPNLLARNAVDYFSECVFRYAQLLYDTKLDETELVAFLILHLLRIAVKKFDVQEQARAIANEIMLGLSEHYRTTYGDVSIRMATVVLLLNESEHCSHRNEELNVMLHLMGRIPVADFFETTARAPSPHPSQERKYYLGAICIDDY